MAHDGARARFGIGVTGLVVGTGWALWHIPLYFVDGTFHHGLGFANSGFWLVSTTLLRLSVLYAWVVDQTRGSILAAVLIHAGANMTSELLPVSAAVRAVELALLAVAALAIVVWTSRPRPR